MAIEYYNDGEWFKKNSWKIKPVRCTCRVYKDTVKCDSCGKTIAFGELCFKGINYPLRLRPSGYADICLQCGYKMMSQYTPNNPLNTIKELEKRITALENKEQSNGTVS